MPQTSIFQPTPPTLSKSLLYWKYEFTKEPTDPVIFKNLKERFNFKKLQKYLDFFNEEIKLHGKKPLFDTSYKTMNKVGNWFISVTNPVSGIFCDPHTKQEYVVRAADIISEAFKTVNNSMNAEPVELINILEKLRNVYLDIPRGFFYDSGKVLPKFKELFAEFDIDIDKEQELVSEATFVRKIFR